MTEPFYDRILVLPLGRSEEGETSLIVPETAKRPMNRARVVRVGTAAPVLDGTNTDPIVKVGDIVFFHRNNAAVEIEEGGMTHLLLRERDILLVEES